MRVPVGGAMSWMGWRWWRFIQGIAVGGEWGGAVLMASEHSPDQSKRTFLASFAQLGSPAGLILATLMFKLVTSFDDAAFLDWAWRVPFLFSALLLAIGFVIRLSVKESPDFLDEQVRREKAAKETKAVVETLPLKEVLKGSSR